VLANVGQAQLAAGHARHEYHAFDLIVAAPSFRIYELDVPQFVAMPLRNVSQWSVPSCRPPDPAYSHLNNPQEWADKQFKKD